MPTFVRGGWLGEKVRRYDSVNVFYQVYDRSGRMTLGRSPPLSYVLAHKLRLPFP